MRAWTKPKLVVEKLELSQAVAAGCGDYDYIEVSCTTNNGKFHPNYNEIYTAGEFIKNLSAEALQYYENENWLALLNSISDHTSHGGHQSMGHALSTRTIPNVS